MPFDQVFFVTVMRYGRLGIKHPFKHHTRLCKRSAQVYPAEALNYRALTDIPSALAAHHQQGWVGGGRAWIVRTWTCSSGPQGSKSRHLAVPTSDAAG